MFLKLALPSSPDLTEALRVLVQFSESLEACVPQTFLCSRSITLFVCLFVCYDKAMLLFWLFFGEN